MNLCETSLCYSLVGQHALLKEKYSSWNHKFSWKWESWWNYTSI